MIPREARIKQLLSVRDLASKARVHEDTVRRAEQGGRVSDLSEERIAQALGFEDRRELFPRVTA